MSSLAALRREWRLLHRESPIRAVVCAYLALLGLGAGYSVLRVQDRAAQVASAAASADARWEGLRRTARASEPTVWSDWRSPSLVGGPTGFRSTWIEVDPLEALSAGESMRRPPVRRVSLYRGTEEPPLENPLTPAGGRLDLAFVVSWGLPLAILAAAHGAVSRDRQRGTWALLASATARPMTVVDARVLLPAGLLAGLTIAAGGLAVLVSSPGTLEQSATGRFGLWAGAVAIYAGFWALLTAQVSMRSNSPSKELLALCLVWLGLVWVVPSLVDGVVTTLVPAPNHLEAHVAMREISRETETELPRMLRDVYRRHPEWEPSAETVRAMQRPVPGGPASRDSRRVYVPAMVAADAAARFETAVGARRASVERLVGWASFLSPALALQRITDVLAGTSTDRFDRFERHVAAVETAWHGFFAPRILQLRDLTVADLERVPLPGRFADVVAVEHAVLPAAGLGSFLLALLVRRRRVALRRLPG